MPYQLKDLYSTRHAALIEALKDKGFSSVGSWKSAMEGARVLVVAKGFNVSKYSACQSIRTIVADGVNANSKPAATVMAGAAVPDPTAVISGAVAKRSRRSKCCGISGCSRSRAATSSGSYHCHWHMRTGPKRIWTGSKAV